MTLTDFVNAPESTKGEVYKVVMEKASQKQAQMLVAGEEDHPICGDDQGLDYLGDKV